MGDKNATIYNDIESVVDEIIEKVGKDVVLGLPLGLAKPVHLINALYQRVKKDPSMSLKMITAISLEKPLASSDLEARLLDPVKERLFGGVPELDYTLDMRRDALPKNVEIAEFYFKPASFLNNQHAQQNYISTNYTHVPRDSITFGVNVFAQSIATRKVDGKVCYSLGSNTDIFLDAYELLKEEEKKGRKIYVVGQVNRKMPFMVNDAEVSEDHFDMIIDNRELDHRLFSTPNRPITMTDHMIGFNASTLLKDGGTLQIGIGSLGDALIDSTIMRQQRNDVYCEVLKDLQLREKFPVVEQEGGHETFEEGLYGNTEMFVHGYMSLYKAGILKRKVYDNLVIQRLVNEGLLREEVTPEIFLEMVKRRVTQSRLTAEDVDVLKRFGIFHDDVNWCEDGLLVGGETISGDLTDEQSLQIVLNRCLGSKLKGGVVLHAAFFLGPESFYKELHNLTEQERSEINMTAISYTNGLFGQLKLKNAQRKHARYINCCMKMTLLGAAASDGLENGQVVSGVGGQYNFVSMAHEEPDARSILLLKSTRTTKTGLESNIVFTYGYITIPRHLRDIVITEYGIADLRGKCDREVVKELINIADSRFQDELVEQAINSGKLAADYQVPEMYRNNLPERLTEVYKKYRQLGCFESYPFGCDYTQMELKLGKVLKSIKRKTNHKVELIQTLIDGLTVSDIPDSNRSLLARLNLEKASSFRQKLMRRLILGELSSDQKKVKQANAVEVEKAGS